MKRARFLDPRPAEIAAANPIADSVNIPLDELGDRMHELPARHAQVHVCGPDPYLSRAIALLAGAEREAVPASIWEFGRSAPGRLWSPNPFLEEVVQDWRIDRIEGLWPSPVTVSNPPILQSSNPPNRRALDLACGTGRDAVYLASLGYEVTALDHLPDALEKGRDLARRYLAEPEAAKITWKCLDLARPGQELGEDFGLVTMFWYLDRDLIRRAASLIARGGSLVMETFTSTHRERFGKPRTEAFVLQPGELQSLAAPLSIRSYSEDWHDGRHSARLWATRAD